jgi:uncharacterized protein (TIGR00730 family)
MNATGDLNMRNFPSAEEDARVLKERGLYGGADSSFRLAFADNAFLLRDELRPVRMQLELLKPELIQQEQDIRSTIVLFGSARISSPEDANAVLDAARAAGDAAAIARAEKGVGMSRYYEEARRFAAIVTTRSREHDTPIYVVTGGGPGIMEAGNRGAFEVGGKSIGLNIVLPLEQAPNAYITPQLCFQFHYFALRKMHFLMRSIAIVSFPGGFGTLDETFESLTLIQTGKSRKRPVLLFGKAFWTKLVDFDWLIDTGMISPGDVDLFHFVETAEEAWAVLDAHYRFSVPRPDGPDTTASSGTIAP